MYDLFVTFFFFFAFLDHVLRVSGIDSLVLCVVFVEPEGILKEMEFIIFNIGTVGRGS